MSPVVDEEKVINQFVAVKSMKFSEQETGFTRFLLFILKAAKRPYKHPFFWRSVLRGFALSSASYGVLSGDFLK